MSVPAKDLISKLLERDPMARLGSGLLGSQEIKQHSFFEGVDWEAVYRRELKPPAPVFSKQKTQTLNPEKVYGDLSRPGDRIPGWSFSKSE
jgi:serine/threonine protein kinase